jgi:hypothetical protein
MGGNNADQGHAGAHDAEEGAESEATGKEDNLDENRFLFYQEFVYGIGTVF